MSDHSAVSENLLKEFPQPEAEAWRALAEEQLGGAPFEKKLITKKLEGIAVQPLYTRADRETESPSGWPGSGDLTRGNAPLLPREGWLISQEMPYGTTEALNEALLADLMRGQNAINVLLDVASQQGKDADTASIGDVGACGVSLSTLGDAAKAFAGVHLEAVPVNFQTEGSTLPVAALYFALARKRNLSPDQLNGSFHADPLGHLARYGEVSAGLDAKYDELASLLEWTERKNCPIAVLGPNGTAYADAGGHAVQELGFALATACDYFRAMTSRGLSPNVIAKRTWWRFSVGPQVFLEIAKFRAARRVWAKMVEAFGGDEEARKAKIHARTGLFHRTRTDAYVNMLRASTESFAAAVGGVDSLHSGPFDEIIREPDSFSRRIARNTQIILQEECNLLDVADPGGGSYFLESLTDQIAAKAWALFQEVETLGGMAKALEQGFPQQQVLETAAERTKRFRQRRDVLVGTNQYANVGENAVERRPTNYLKLHQRRSRELAEYRVSAESDHDAKVLSALENVMHGAGSQRVDAAIEAAYAGASLGEISRSLQKSDATPAKIEPVRGRRLSTDYERLREASLFFASDHGHAPRLYLANFGPLRQHKLRADFTRAFFEPGGFEVVYAPGETDPAKIAENAAASGAKVVVICSTDDAYPEAVPAIAKAIKTKDPSLAILLAGYPGDHESAYREAGLDDYIFVKSNNYDVVAKYLIYSGAAIPSKA